MNNDIALTLANQSVEIERLKERVAKLEKMLLPRTSGTLHPSDRSEMVPIRVAEEKE